MTRSVEEMISKGWRLVTVIPENNVVKKNGAESDLFELTVGVDWRGFEPLTPRVQGEYSTAELPAHCMI